MIHPASELSTYYWLQNTTSLGEILNENFNFISLMSLYRTCDFLLTHKDKIEEKIFNNISYNKSCEDIVALYDIKNTCIEGQPHNNKVQFGLSKEKRSDCLLVSLAIIIDAPGFIRKSLILPGNISEHSTLEDVLNQLNPAPNPLFIMDRSNSW
jgi:transposase